MYREHTEIETKPDGDDMEKGNTHVTHTYTRTNIRTYKHTYVYTVTTHTLLLRDRKKKRRNENIACLCVAGLPPRFLIERPSLFLQLRVIRAFKSTLEDLEERRSVHSLHSLHSMRSSRSHTGPRPLSDFTYIDEDPTNTAQNAANRSSSNRSAEPNQDYETNYRGSRMQSLNSPASPLLLSVTGPAVNAYNHHYTINTTTDNRFPSSNALNQPLSPNHTAQTSSNRDNTGNSLLLSSNNLVLPELTKLVHETSI